MSKPTFGYRIWQLWPSAPDWPPVLTSVTPKEDLRRLQERPLTRRAFDSWETINFKASCRENPLHLAPVVECTCGIYAYPDLLDGLRLISQYCRESYYAFGLVEGYGGIHNDGAVVLHDACMRFAEADITAFVALGSAHRQGWVYQLAKNLKVPLLTIDEAEQLVNSGERVSSKANRQPGTRYLEDLAVGQKGDIAVSALVADRTGRLYLRNDRKVRNPGIARWARLKTIREPGDGFHVYGFYPDQDLAAITLFPFDGEEELSKQSTRLAGRVVSVNFLDVEGERKPILVARSRSNEALRLPKKHQKRFLDLMQPGDRLEISHQCLSFDADGTVWLGRELYCNPTVGMDDPTNSYTDTPKAAKFFVTTIEDGEFGLEIELNGKFQPSLNIDRHGQGKDTRVRSISVNGKRLPDAVIPVRMVDSEGYLIAPGSSVETGL